EAAAASGPWVHLAPAATGTQVQPPGLAWTVLSSPSAPPAIRLTPTGSETLAVSCRAGAGPAFVTLNPTIPVLPGGSAPTGLIRVVSWEPGAGAATAGGDGGAAGG